MEASFWQRLSGQTISVDQTSQPLTLEAEQVERFYLPIARWLMDGAPPGRRLAALVGPPGAGKSTFAALLTAVINAWQAEETAIVVGQDGWHYPNTYLDSHTIQSNGQTLPLRAIKGMPPTFDVDGLRATLQKMKTGQAVSFPVYSRQTHDPLAGAGRVAPHHRLVIIEGNYLLLDCPPWSGLRHLFDRTLMITAAREQLLAGLRGRHARGGKDAAAIERQIQQVDLPNIDLVLSSSVQPDLLIEKSNQRQIGALHFRP